MELSISWNQELKTVDFHKEYSQVDKCFPKKSELMIGIHGKILMLVLILTLMNTSLE